MQEVFSVDIETSSLMLLKQHCCVGPAIASELK